MEIRAVGVIGLGTMGAGIADVFARGGLAVTAVEVDPDALTRGMATIEASLGKAVARGRLTLDEQAEILGRVRPGAKLADLADVDLVVEVVPEQLAIKRQIIAELDQLCRPDAIIATNTSSLSVTAIAGGTAHPDRVVGMHFFNPAPVMRLVEVVTTVLTAPGVASAVTDLARRLGKTPVRVDDRAGFVANALLLPYLNHAVRLLETGYASREDIDAAATLGIGLPMGPLTLLDLIGLDTSLAILDVLQREFGGTRYTAAPLLRRLTDAGLVGRKSGRGFYEYGSKSAPSEPVSMPTLIEARPPATVTLIDPAPSTDGAGPGDNPRTAADMLGARPGEDPRTPAGMLGASPGDDSRTPAGMLKAGDRSANLASMIAAAGINVTRNPAHRSDLAVVAIGPRGGVLGPAMAADRAANAIGLHLAAPGFAELVPTPLTAADTIAAGHALAAQLDLRAVTCADRPGLLVGALLYPHLKDAVTMVADGYASPADVDAAMTLGCGYQRGPMAMLADAGLGTVADGLLAMHTAYGDPAFAPPPLLMDWVKTGRVMPQTVRG